jgi:MFS family permease
MIIPPVLRRRSYARLFLALLSMGLGSQMVAVAVGWQVYAIRHSAFDLGLIGLAEFVPLPLLALPAGHLADRFSRRSVFAFSLALNVAVTLGLLAVA